MTDKTKNVAEELKRIRSILSAITGFEDDDQEYVEDARKSVDRIIDALAEHPAQPAQPAQQALDKMAENARELGLDYEPKPAPLRDAIVANLVREGINKHRARELADHFVGLVAQQPAQQEPVAWLHPANATCVTTDPTAYARGIPLYTSPPTQQEPLTDEQIVAKALHLSWLVTSPDLIQFARAIEAAHHGIKENT